MIAASPLLWLATWLAVRWVYDGRVPVVSDRLFRSRDAFDLSFYLELTEPLRVGAALALLLVGTLIVLYALRMDGRWHGRSIRNGWRLLRGAFSWVPSSTPGQTVAVLAAGGLVALASGYRAVPSLGNDVVTYIPAARKYFDSAYLLGDLPIRDADASLMVWGLIVRGAAAVFGFEGAFLAVSILGGALLAYGLHRLIGTTLGAGHRVGLVGAMVGLTVTFGPFGYELAIPSHAAFYPTPRFLAIAVSVVAISLVLERALARGVVLGLMSTAINTLDGLIPVGLAILALLLAREGVRGSHPRLRRVTVTSATLTLTVLALRWLVAGGPAALSSALSDALPGPLVIVTVATLLAGIGSLLVSAHRSGSGRWSLSDRSRIVVSGFVLAVGGALFASRRGSGADEGFLEGVRTFETVLLQVRQAPAMLVLSATGVLSALLFVALLLATLSLATLHAPRVAREDADEEERAARISAMATYSVLAAAFVTVGSVLMERTGLPFLVSLWPIRTAWVVVLTFVALLFVRLGERGVLRRVGVVPASVVGLVLLEAPLFGRSAWSIGLVVAAAGFVLLETFAVTGRVLPPLVRPAAVRVLVVVLPFLLVVPLLARIPAPELGIADSMARIEERGGLDAEIVQMARLANALTPPDARILIPPGPAWGAFRLLSERGVAFEWKNFSTAQAGEWYAQLRWMCDPQYRFDETETFVVGRRDVEQCYASLDGDGIRRVGARFEADYAVVLVESAPMSEMVGISLSGQTALVHLR